MQTTVMQPGPAIAVRVLRRALADHAADRLAQPRETGRTAIDPRDRSRFERLIELDEALVELQVLHPRQAQVFEYCYFGCMDAGEAARVLGIPAATAEGDFDAARAWLGNRMRRDTMRAVH